MIKSNIFDAAMDWYTAGGPFTNIMKSIGLAAVVSTGLAAISTPDLTSFQSAKELTNRPKSGVSSLRECEQAQGKGKCLKQETMDVTTIPYIPQVGILSLPKRAVYYSPAL